MAEKGRPIRLLLVEDDPDDAELVVLELKQAGFEVETRRVWSAPAMQEALTTGVWDIVISDFAMPGFNGLEAFELLTSLDLDIPFIFVSGALGEECAVQAMRAGARDYLLKDNLKRLAEAVRRELKELASRRQRQRVEVEARREATRLGMAVEASGAGVYEHRVPPDAGSYYNDRWAEILGFLPDELPPPEQVPAWFAERIHSDDRAAFLIAYEEFLAGQRERFEAEARIAHKNGAWASVALFCKAVERDGSGGAVRIVGVMLDLTHHRRLEEQLRQAQKLESIGRLAGGVAHDFNNLLTVIQSFAGFVMDALEPGSQERSDMREVLHAADRAAMLTRQLLAFSRRQAIEPRVVSINALVDGMDKMLRRLLGEDIRVVTSLAPDAGNVRVDPSAFEQVLLNLAINARDAMPAGGMLTIDTFNEELTEPFGSRPGVEVPPGRYVGFAMSDDGVGMDAETQAQIFEPFFTTKAAGKGTGLGLSTCFGIVRQAGGYILFYSEPGRGTTMCVLLPQADAAAESAPVRAVPSVLAGTETVLVAEDDEQLRRLCVRALSEHGYRVIEAENGARALQLGVGRGLDLLLTDIVMPGIGGAALAAELGAVHPEMRVLFMSGYTEGAIAHHGVLQPGAELLQKPFTPEGLVRRVRALLDRR